MSDAADAGATDTGSTGDAAVESFAADYEQNSGAADDAAAAQDSSNTDQKQDADQGQDDTTSDDKSDESSKEADEADADKSKDDKGKDDEGSDEDAKEAQSYEDFSFPEGLTIDQDSLGEVSEILAEHEVPQEAAQKVMDVGAKMMSKMAENAAANHQKTVDGWGKNTQEQFGKDGDAAFEEKTATAQMALEKFMPKEQLEVLNSWGVGNMSGIFAMAYTLGQAMKEDGSFTSASGNPANSEETVADIWYGKSNG